LQGWRNVVRYVTYIRYSPGLLSREAKVLIQQRIEHCTLHYTIPASMKLLPIHIVYTIHVTSPWIATALCGND
jgi:hypothetical protein